MANIAVTSSTSNFIIDFGDYVSVTGIKKATWQKQRISFRLMASDSFVQVLVVGEPNWAVSFNGSANTLQIDSVNSVAPTSNSDLYDKLIALIA